MKITKEQFRRYEEVRISGRTNMFDLRNVMAMSDLAAEQCKEIVHNYLKLKEKYQNE